MNPTNQPIRILIVDDQWLVREGIASMLEIDEMFKVVGTAADGQEAIDQAHSTRPDVILMDIRMPNMSGIEAAGKISQTHPNCHIIMLTTFDDDEYVVQSLLAGACGYLMKDTPAKDLMQAIRLANQGIFQLGPEVAGNLVGSLQKQQSTPAPAEEIPLTQREIEILILLANGATNKEIAEKIVVTEGTVKNHVSNILKRLDLRDRTQAAVYAVRHGLA
ncbi:MAG: response regulator transcription factor [Chloroflexota bacterium]